MKAWIPCWLLGAWKFFSGRWKRFISPPMAADIRFRAILMTAFSSILGFMPLLVAAGAGAASRQAVGNAVVGGMFAATIFSLTFVPTFFVIFRGLGEMGGKVQTSDEPPNVPAQGEAKPEETASARVAESKPGKDNEARQ